MVSDDPNHLLYIHPKPPASPELIDELTLDTEGLLRRGKPIDHCRGFHQCTGCGAVSTNYELELPNGMITNSLAAHYVKCHRDEIPKAEIVKLLFAIRNLKP